MSANSFAETEHGRVAEWLKAPDSKLRNAVFTNHHVSASLINIGDFEFVLLTNPQKDAKKAQTVSNGSIKF